MIHITLKLLGPFRSLAAGADTDGTQQLALAPGTCLSETLQGTSFPKDVPMVVLLNGAQCTDDPQLRDGDVVVVFPPIAGGCLEGSCRS